MCYIGIYLAVALLFITKLFDLYRLNWWPRSLGGLTCYTFFWAVSLAVGFGCHWGDVFGIGRRRDRTGGGDGDEIDWERKSTSFFSPMMIERSPADKKVLVGS